MVVANRTMGDLVYNNYYDHVSFSLGLLTEC